VGFRRTIREPVLWDWATHSLSNYRCRRERHALWSRVGRVRFLLSLDTIDFDAQGGGGEMTLHGMGKPSPPQAGHFPENHHTRPASCSTPPEDKGNQDEGLNPFVPFGTLSHSSSQCGTSPAGDGEG